MIYLHLFLGFLKVGCFSFGGAYGAIPLIRDVVLSYGWMTEEELTYMIAVSESTPSRMERIARGLLSDDCCTEFFAAIRAGFLVAVGEHMIGQIMPWR